MYMDLTDMISGGTEEQQIPETEIDQGRICSQEAAGKRRGMG